MEKFENLINKTLMPFANVLSRNRFMIALKNGMVKVTPLTMIGSMFLVISSLPNILSFIPAYSPEIYKILYFPYTMCFGIIAIVAVAAIAYALAEQNEKSNPFIVAISSIVVFLVVCAPSQEGTISVTFLGAQGLFSAIFIGLSVPVIIDFLDKKEIKIKMPDSVPPNITASFESIIPMGIALIIFYFLSVFCQYVSSGMIIPQFINSLLTPAIQGSESPIFITIFMCCVQLLFFFGIHGSSILFSFITPFMINNMVANAEMFANGIAPTHALTVTTLYISGYYFPIWAYLFMKCKSARLKEIGKIAFVPAVFNIQEPMQFGAPIFLNPLLFIPYILTTGIGTGLTVFLMDAGIIGCVAIDMPSVVPLPFMAILSTFDWRIVIWWLVLAIFNYIVWKPFVNSYDKQCLEEEKGS